MLVVFGQRRVGKTFLIREYYASKDCVFLQVTGIQEDTAINQLKNFAESISITFFDKVPIETPKAWRDAFNLLQNQIHKTKKKLVIFLDELPWLAARKSRLLQEIDYLESSLVVHKQCYINTMQVISLMANEKNYLQ